MFVRRGFWVLLVPLIASALLAGCGGGDERARIPEKKPLVEQPRISERELRQCMADLRAAEVKYDPLPDRIFGGGCSAIASVKLLDVGVPVANLGAMQCPLARTFAQWAYYAAMPAARKFLGSELVRIETMGSYACRNVNGNAYSSGRLSEHAFANAVDVAAFLLADGRRVTVTSGWNGSSDERAFLRALHQSACKRFQTVLGPDYNRAHYDHLHFDMGRGPYCR